MLGDHRQDLLSEDLDERRSTNHGALMCEQDGETVSRRRGGPGWLRTARALGWSSAAALKEVKQRCSSQALEQSGASQDCSSAWLEQRCRAERGEAGSCRP